LENTLEKFETLTPSKEREVETFTPSKKEKN